MSADTQPVSRPLVDAAVLVPVYRDPAGALRIVMLRRTEGGVHGGQIAFPGGKLDASDASLRDAALREAFEEIGLARESVTVIDELESVDVRVTGFRIHPFLAWIERPAEWRMAVREVAEVLEPTVTDLGDPANQDSSMERFPQWPEPIRIEFIRLGDHRLWGATLRIVRPLLARLERGDWERLGG